jgi:hypothetical protein
MTTMKKGVAKNDHTVVGEAHFMKVMENEKSREEKTRAPEGIRNPGIQVQVIWGRRIVC